MMRMGRRIERKEGGVGMNQLIYIGKREKGEVKAIKTNEKVREADDIPESHSLSPFYATNRRPTFFKGAKNPDQQLS